MDVQVRPIESGDLPAIYRILQQKYVMQVNPVLIPSTRFDQFEARVGNAGPDEHAFVAVLNDAVIGRAGLRIMPAQQSHGGMLSVTVDSAHHGKGVGTALIAKLLDLADAWLMLERVELVVLANNPRAQSLYERFGFKVIGKRTGAFRCAGAYVDGIFMERLRPGGRLDHAGA